MDSTHCVIEALDQLASAGLDSEIEDVLLEYLPDRDGLASSEFGWSDVFIESIFARGYRGIADGQNLKLPPGPGLAFVVGLNGAGKSSFAEAAELALTGTTTRWDKAQKDARENWRNIVNPSKTLVRVELRETNGSVAKVERHWEENIELDQSQLSVKDNNGSATDRFNGLAEAVRQYPPLLADRALPKLTDGKLSELFDAFDPLLGLEDLDETQRNINSQVKEIRSATKLATGLKKEVLSLCESSTLPEILDLRSKVNDGSNAGKIYDDFHRQVPAIAVSQPVRQCLGLDPLDLEEVKHRLARIDETVAKVEDESRKGNQTLTRVADLLEQALQLQEDEQLTSCPVCETGQLNQEWRDKTAITLKTHRSLTAALKENQRLLQQELHQLQTLLEQTTKIGFSDDLPELEAASKQAQSLLRSISSRDSNLVDLFSDFELLDMQISETQTAAKRLVENNSEEFKPLLDLLDSWRKAQQKSDELSPTKRSHEKALTWIKSEITRQRSIRLEAINTQITNTWQKFSGSDDLKLDPLELTGSTNRRKVSLTCQTGGSEANARSIFSQGQLHALALSIFLPRATHKGSPFKFLLIDDPVQSFDEWKTDGLASVLEELAQTRQVVVFTHDERLPKAASLLGITASVINITRNEDAALTITKRKSAATQALKEAYIMSKDEQLSPDAKVNIVAVCCRAAIESYAIERYRHKANQQGTPIEEIESCIKQSEKSVWDKISLGLYCEIDRGTAQKVETSHGQEHRNLITTLNKKSHHDPQAAEVHDLYGRTRKTIDKLFTLNSQP